MILKKTRISYPTTLTDLTGLVSRKFLQSKAISNQRHQKLKPIRQKSVFFVSRSVKTEKKNV